MVMSSNCTDPSLDPMTVQVAGAFLLNIHLYTFLAAQDQPSPGKVRGILATWREPHPMS